MDWNTLQQVVRMLALTVAGFLAGRGYLDQGATDYFVSAVMAVSTFVWWGLWNRKREPKAGPGRDRR